MIAAHFRAGGALSKIALVAYLAIAVIAAPLLLPDKASAAGETYTWMKDLNGYLIRGSGGEFSKTRHDSTVRGYHSARYNPPHAYFYTSSSRPGVYGAKQTITFKVASQTAERTCEVTYVITLISATSGRVEKWTPTEGFYCDSRIINETNPITIQGTPPPNVTLPPPGTGNPPAGNPPAGDPTNEEPDDICAQDSSELGWVICPMSGLLIRGATALDELIIEFLKVNTDDIFGNESESGQAFRTAWGVFRNIAYGVLIILGLIMVLSQIAGLDVFDAYTIRKMLPKMVIAAIFIPLLFPLLNLVFQMSNDSADAVMQVMDAPFRNVGREAGFGDAISAASGVALIMGGLGAGVTFLYFAGWGFFFSIAGTVFIAVLSAFILMAARDILIYMLVIFSPIAVVCSVFEPFRNAFTAWRNLLISVLLSIPIVAAILTAGKIAAAIAIAGGWL